MCHNMANPSAHTVPAVSPPIAIRQRRSPLVAIIKKGSNAPLNVSTTPTTSITPAINLIQKPLPTPMSGLSAYIDIIQDPSSDDSSRQSLDRSPLTMDRYRWIPAAELLRMANILFDAGGGSSDVSSSWTQISDAVDAWTNLGTYAYAAPGELSPFQSSIFYRQLAELYPVTSSPKKQGVKVNLSSRGVVYTDDLSMLTTSESHAPSSVSFPKSPAGEGLSITKRGYFVPAGYPILVTGVTGTLGKMIPIWSASRSPSTWNDRFDAISVTGASASNILSAALSVYCNWEYIGKYRATSNLTSAQVDAVVECVKAGQVGTALPPVQSTTASSATASISSLADAGVYIPMMQAGTLPASVSKYTALGSFYLSTATRDLFDSWFMGHTHTLASKQFSTGLEIASAAARGMMAYNKEIKSLERRRMIQARCLFIAKTKYPNLFNPASREFMFKEDKHFSLDKLPLPIATAIQIELESSMDQYITATHANMLTSCEHYAMVSKWRKGHYQDLRLLDDIKSILVDGDKAAHTGNWLVCKICDQRVMCPHEFEMSQTAPEKLHVIRNKYCKRKTTNHANSAGWHCDICGEELNDKWDADESGLAWGDYSSGSYNSGNQSTSSQQWGMDADSPQAKAKQVAYFAVRDRMKYTPTDGKSGSTKPITRREIQQVIADVVSYYADKGDLASNSSNRSSGKNTAAVNLDLIVIVFTYACLVACSVLSKGDMLIYVPGMVFAADTRSQFMAAFAAIRKYHADVSTIVKEDDLKELLVRAYGAVRADIGEMLFNVLIDSAVVDYDYATDRYHRMGKYIQSSKGVPKNGWAFPALKYSQPGDALEKDWQSYVRESWKLYDELVHSQMNNPSVGQIPLNDRESSSLWNKWVKSSTEMMEREMKIVKANHVNITYPLSKGLISNARYYYAERDAAKRNLAVNICMATRGKHRFDKWVVITPGGKETLSKKQLGKYVEDIELRKKITWHDRQCSACGKTVLELRGGNVSNQMVATNLKKAIDDHHDAGAFYSMFEHRCLVDGFHEWKDNGKGSEVVCTKCKMPWSAWWGKSDWYKSHIGAYQSAILQKKNESIAKLRELKSTSAQSTHSHSNVPLTKPVENIKATCRWADETSKGNAKGNMEVVMAFNAEFGIDAAAIKAIGNTEGVQQGEGSPDVCSPLLISRKIYEHVLFVKRHLSVWIALCRCTFTGTVSTKSSEYRAVYRVLSKYSSKFKELWGEYANSSGKKEVGDLPNALSRLQMSAPSPTVLLTTLIAVKKDSPALANYLVEAIFAVDVLYTKFDYGELKKVFRAANVADHHLDESMDEDMDTGDDIDLFDYSDLSMDNMADDDIDA